MSDYNPILDPEALLTTEQCALMRGCSASTIRRERRERRGVPFIEINCNTVRYRRQDVVDFISKYRVDVDNPS
ncbi:MAG: hypothetical protein H6961_01450 [Chromatiaceae bacterium]|nr:hypothetical protein [Chromatiaceae bacterium]HPE81692.1 hypothetical protein [Gammaproteobacteria bacterium]